jgi:hypothetical protein
MGFQTWGDFYHSDLQSLWLLVVLPTLFLAYLLLRGRPAGTRRERFLRGFALVFGVETLLDPLATGPLTRALGLSEGAATALMLPFVWLGDFRVLLLLCAEGGGAPDLGAAARRAAALTCLVPAAAALLYAPAWLGLADWPGQVLWLVYEVGFTALAAWLCLRAPDPALRAIALYACVYYALWAAADVLILLGVDAGWGLRVIPNQLYYAFFVPFAWFRLTRGEPRASTPG